MRAALRRGRIPPVPVDEPMLRLPKVAFAHLTQLPFSAPRALSALLSDDAAKQRAAEIGVKLTVGLELLEQNTRLTQLTRELSERIEVLASEIHAKVVAS